MVKKITVLLCLFFLFPLTSCIENEEWVGLVYYKGNNPLHIGTFDSLDKCIRVTTIKAGELGYDYDPACLSGCSYNYDLGWDVCEKDADF